MDRERIGFSTPALGLCAAAALACAGGLPFLDREPPPPCPVRELPPGGPDASAPGHEIAIAALGGDPAATPDTEWEELAQEFWPQWRVYRIVDPAHPSRVLAAAVDRRGRAVELTRRRALARRENPALACFNALSKREGVRVARANVEAYLAFFLWTQLPDVEQFLRGRADAQAVLTHPWQGRHDEYLLAELEETVEPVFELHPAGRGFTATAFDWHWSRGVVYRYDLGVAPDGEVRFHDAALGSQPPQFGPLSTASCFAVHPDGLVLTASHAVARAHSITLRFVSGEERPATLERAEPGSDLALLRVAAELPAILPLAEREPEPGEPVFTLGFPAPRRLWSEPEYGAGTVRGRGSAPYLIATDVVVRAGNSGGPLVDERGLVVGVISRIQATPDDRWHGTLAVRAAEARALLGSLPEPPPPAATRAEAQARVRAAVCEVEVEQLDGVEAGVGAP